MRKYKVFILIITCFLVKADIFSIERSDSKNVWASKKFSIGLSGGLGFDVPSFTSIGVEIPTLSYRPIKNLQLTLKGGYQNRVNSSFLFGYTNSRAYWRWFVEGGVNVNWLHIFFIGPEVSAGVEYMVIDWLSFGIKLNTSFMIDPYSQGCCSEGYSANLTHLENTLSLNVSSIF